jgi:hypothetical protein
MNGNAPFGFNLAARPHRQYGLLFKTQLRVSVDITPDFAAMPAAWVTMESMDFHPLNFLKRCTAHKDATRHASYARQCTHAFRKTSLSQSLA